MDEKNVPIDGLSIFIDQTWQVIRDQKELNLPDQREMVANYRCNEIKEEATTQVLMDIDLLKKDAETRLVDNFEERCKKILQEAIQHFDE